MDRQIEGISALGDPVRRSLYLYVARSGHDVGRDEAAAATGVSRSLAAFHLDKLVESGLLDATFRRLTGKQGPGAGRPSKLYLRGATQLEVSLPPRRYELAAHLFADALAGGGGAGAPLSSVARDFGARIGSEARELAGPNADRGELLDAAEAVLNAYGYEPFTDEEGVIRLHNCPFDALARDHRSLVCGMNLHLLEGVVDGLGPESEMKAVLEPRPGQCCVALYLNAG